MLKNETVFIVGAGASDEFGLPVGAKLQAEIASLLRFRFGGELSRRLVSGDPGIYELLRHQYGAQQLGDYMRAAEHVSDAIPLSHSIDNFLDTHHHDARVIDVGKIAIAKCILDAERGSTLWIDRSNKGNDIDLSALASTWIGRLFVAMQEGLRAEYAERFFDKAAFVVFNYDRCVEQYFLRALMRYFRFSEERAAAIVNGAIILHPYGTLGYLPSLKSIPQAVEFGYESCSFVEIAKGIRTYTEIADQDVIDQIRRTIAKAETICFLGFAYQQQNMDLITPKNGSSAKTVMGTAFEMSEFALGSVRSQLGPRLQLNGETVYLDPLKCGEFIRKFDRAFRV